jgi:hypothetical protein
MLAGLEGLFSCRDICITKLAITKILYDIT